MGAACRRGVCTVGRYEGAWLDDEIHGQGTYTAAVPGWSLTGAFAHDRPTAGELTEADGRRYAVQYAPDCGTIFQHPAPSSKVRARGAAVRPRERGRCCTGPHARPLTACLARAADAAGGAARGWGCGRRLRGARRAGGG